MANVKNFGLIGVGSELQFGKGSSKIINTAGTFNLRASDNTTPVALSAAGITSSAGNVTLTTGNVVLSSTAGTIGIGGDVTLQRQSAGVLQQTGTGAFMLPTGNNATRPTGATGMIRVNNEGTPTVEFFDGTNWTQVGGAAALAALQTEVNNIETSLGAGVNSDGTFNQDAFTDNAALTNPASFTDAINQIAAAAAATDTLDEIFPSLANGNVIYSAGGVWAQAAPGATSGVQGYDAGLANLAAKTSTGIVVQTGDDTFTSVSLVQPAAGITITNADGVAGNPTFALANDLAALEGLATNGFIVRTGDGTATTRSVTGTAERIVVTNGDGVASSPTIDLAEVTNPGNGGTFVKVTTDAYGRVTNSTAVVAADITTLVDSTYVNVTGDTMTGTLTMSGSGVHVVLPNAPTDPSHAANKAYVDSVAEGLAIKPAVEIVATAASELSGGNYTYDNGPDDDGVGATITANANGAFPAIDGITLTSTVMGQNGVLVAIGGASGNLINGRYNLTQVGDGSNPWVLTRCGLCDESDEIAGAYTFVKRGTTYAGSGWVQSWLGGNTGTIGTTAIVVDQFSGAGAYQAGAGLELAGNTFNVLAGAGLGLLPAGQVGVDVVSGLALQLTGTAAGDQLTFLLNGGTASGLEQSASGLRIGAGLVTNAMLANSSVSTDADTGTGTLSLGGTLNIIGTSTQGISTSVSGADFTITAADASSAQKGVASFVTGDFTVTSGSVAIDNVSAAKGGTGQNSYTIGDLLVATGATSLGKLAIGTAGQFLKVDGGTAVWATLTAGDLTGTLGVANGGTGATSFTAGRLLIGNGTDPIATDAELTYNAGTDTLTVGSATIQGASGGDVTITATATNADINLVPNGTGQVVIGSSGAGVIAAGAGEKLTVTGNATLELQSTAGDIVMLLPSGQGSKVAISGPSAADYATGLDANDLVNKQYVDTAIQSGAASGSIKAVKATVNLESTGSTNIGAALPAGATVLRVKVQVTAADTGTGTLVVGVGGDNRYMVAAENDTQTTGIYLSETYVVEAGSVQVQATVAGSPAGSGSAVVFVEYQVA